MKSNNQPPEITEQLWRWNGYGFKAMNTRVYAWLYSYAANSSEILQDVQALFNSVERKLSRFIPGNELAQLNKAATPFTAGPTLFEAVSIALWAAQATGGLFDPTVLSNLERAGYNRTFDSILQQAAEPGEISARPQPGQFLQVNLNRAARTISKPQGLKFDLGGIGKGWTVDRAADRLLGLGPFLVNAGGDLYAYGTPPGRSGWKIDITHPENDSLKLATLSITNRAVATSSITRRRWQQGKQWMHHLIDPRTGCPAATDLLSVTVVGDRTATAEVFAKVALIIGSTEGLTYLESIPNVEGLLLTNGGNVLQTSGLKTRQQTAVNTS